MFKQLTTTLFFVLTLNESHAQLSGIANLNGQSDHSGIKVKFIAAAATSITDSTYTNSSGAYSINISGGLYKIVFSKSGYQSVYFNNTNPLLLTNSTVLSPLFLYSGNIVNVSGNQSGNWVNTNIYVVTGNITIPQGSTLTIQPGTVVKFNGTFTLTAMGALLAIGNSGNPILFTTNNTSQASGDWYGISLKSTQSNIQYCKIEYAMNAVEIENASPLISNNEITKFYHFGIVAINSGSMLKENTIHDFNAIWSAQGITTDNSVCTIECNTIYNGARSGIRPSSSSKVKNNLIHHILEPTRGYGIDCGWNVSSQVENNIIHHCLIGIEMNENITPAPTPTLVNNTIYENRTGISMSGFYASPAIIGNIIVSNTVGIFQSQNIYSTPSIVSYNLLWNNVLGNYNAVQISAIGQIVNTNINGDPVDSYYNLYIDPLFSNNTAPFLASNSPCLNAGDSNYSTNIGCNPSNMCASMILGIKGVDKNTSALAFPNPFVSNIRISGLKTNNVSALRFYDISGKMFEASYELNSVFELTVKAEDLHPGVYFLEIVFSNSSKTYLRVIKE